MTSFRQFLVFVLVAALAAPAWGESSAVVGVALNSQHASVRGGSLITGSTVFSGDSISADQQGDARIAIAGGAQIDVLPNSAAVLTRAESAIQMQVQRGSVSFRSEPNAAVEAVMADATIRAAHGNSAVGVITMESPESALVVADRNALEIFTERDSKTLLVPQGAAARITLVTADPQDGSGQPNGQNPPAAAGKGPRLHWGLSKKWTFALVALVVGGGILAGGIYAATHEPQVKNVVDEISPFQISSSSSVSH